MNQRTFNEDDHKGFPTTTITRADGRIVASQAGNRDILSDMTSIHQCINRYTEKITAAVKEDEGSQVGFICIFKDSCVIFL